VVATVTVSVLGRTLENALVSTAEVVTVGVIFNFYLISVSLAVGKGNLSFFTAAGSPLHEDGGVHILLAVIDLFLLIGSLVLVGLVECLRVLAHRLAYGIEVALILLVPLIHRSELMILWSYWFILPSRGVERILCGPY
jgi:hypothetical protein